MEKNLINMDKKTVLITGAAGFIGSNLVGRLLKEFKDIKVIGIDNMNDYYDIKLKQQRLLSHLDNHSFIFIKGNIADKGLIQGIFTEHKPDIVINLAAQASEQYSAINPDAYIESNLVGFFNILEECRNNRVDHLLFASSSSICEKKSSKLSLKDDSNINHKSLYGVTKESNELMAYSYSKLYEIPSTGLRFFTVYGPEGRPDMAYFSFTNKLLSGEIIQIYNYGNCKRDFTYIDDIIEGVVNVMKKAPDKDENGVNYKVYNIGNNEPVNLLDFVDILQQELVRAELLPEDFDFEKHRELVPMQPGDVETTYADVTDLVKDFSFKPNTDLRRGLREFVEWYKELYSF